RQRQLSGLRMRPLDQGCTPPGQKREQRNPSPKSDGLPAPLRMHASLLLHKSHFSFLLSCVAVGDQRSGGKIDDKYSRARGRRKENTMVQQILVGLDGSPLAETILPYVTVLAKGVGAEVTLLHVVHLPEEVQEGEHYQTVQPLIQQADTQAQDYLGGVVQQLAGAGLK